MELSIERGSRGRKAATNGDNITTAVSPSGSQTVIADLRWSQSGDTHNALFGTVPGSANGIELMVTNTSGTIWYAHKNNFAINNTSQTMATNTRAVHAFVYDTAVGARIYYNGSQTASDSSTGTLPAANPLQFFLRGDSSATFEGQGTFFWALVFNRALSAAEVAYWTERRFNSVFYRDEPIFIPTAVGGTTVNLPGASSTAAAGTPTVTGAASVTVTGASSTGAVGTMTATGAAIAAILGVSSTGAVGSPTVTGAASTVLTGASATGSAGTLTATGAANITITGVSSTGQVGALTVTVGGAVTVGLTGVSATGRVGLPTVTGAASVNVTGASATGQPGTITATVGGTTVILTGAGATGRVGTLSITGAANIAMSGASATGAAGSLSVTIPGSEAHIVATITITPAIGGTLDLQPAIDGTITIN